MAHLLTSDGTMQAIEARDGQAFTYEELMFLVDAQDGEVRVTPTDTADVVVWNVTATALNVAATRLTGAGGIHGTALVASLDELPDDAAQWQA